MGLCAHVPRMLCPTVVGRAEELAWLSAGFDALRDGHGRCMFLVGEPGIGKSRLAEKAIAEAGDVTSLCCRVEPARPAARCPTNR